VDPFREDLVRLAFDNPLPKLREVFVDDVDHKLGRDYTPNEEDPLLRGRGIGHGDDVRAGDVANVNLIV